MSRSWSGRLAAIGIGAAALALGVIAESVAYDRSAVRSWAPDLSVGLGLVALGLAARFSARPRRVGSLLCAAGLAWFLGNFAAAADPALSWLGLHGAYVHRALLVAAVFVLPRRRLGPGLWRCLLAFALLASLWPALARSETVAVALGAVIVVAALLSGRELLPAAVALAVAVGGVAAGRLLLQPDAEETLLTVYQAGILATAALLVFAVWGGRATSAVTDRVVELGETASLREVLRRVLDDPSLELGFPSDGGYVDERGQPLGKTPRGRRVTELAAGEAVLVHDPSLRLEASLADAVAGALRLTTEHARLQAETYAQLAELRGSRRRLVLARERQRALMARRLRDSAGRRLAALEGTLADVDAADPVVGEAISLARARVGEACSSVAALAQGLQPPALASAGLPGALRALVSSSPVPVSLTVDERRLEAAVEHAVLFVCSEALANVAKHAHATRAEVRVAVDSGGVRLAISDDGCGAADPRGSGLRGLAERIDELGGELDVESPLGGGTRVAVAIPVRGDPTTIKKAAPIPAPAAPEAS